MVELLGVRAWPCFSEAPILKLAELESAQATESKQQQLRKSQSRRVDEKKEGITTSGRRKKRRRRNVSEGWDSRTRMHPFQDASVELMERPLLLSLLVQSSHVHEVRGPAAKPRGSASATARPTGRYLFLSKLLLYQIILDLYNLQLLLQFFAFSSRGAPYTHILPRTLSQYDALLDFTSIF